MLQRSKPRKFTGLDLAEARLSNGDVNTASDMAKKVLANQSDTLASTADAARAHFILARVDLMTGHPESQASTSTTFRKPLQPAKNCACLPGRISILAACSIWSASATKR